MKKSTKVIYLIELLLTIFLIVLMFKINNISNDFKNNSAIVVLSIILIFLLTYFGIKKDNGYLKGSSARTIIAILMTYILVVYGLGIILGFNRGFFTKNIFLLIKNILPVLIITVELEMIRFIVVKNCYKSKKNIIIFTIISSIFRVLLEINLGTLNNAENRFIFLSTIIFPILAEEALCSFMSYKIAMFPSLIYKIVMNLSIYLLPIMPNLGNYLYSVAHILLPFIIYNTLNKMIIKYEKEKQKVRQSNKIIFTIPLITFLIILVLLISGISKFKLIAIASNSMSPTYKRGDAVIYEKMNINDFEVGDVLAFQKNSIVITHRITKIWKQGNQYYFTTKGDNNNTEDNFNVEEKEALGKVRFIFKYIGYPTVIVSEYFGKE